MQVKKPRPGNESDMSQASWLFRDCRLWTQPPHPSRCPCMAPSHAAPVLVTPPPTSCRWTQSTALAGPLRASHGNRCSVRHWHQVRLLQGGQSGLRTRVYRKSSSVWVVRPRQETNNVSHGVSEGFVARREGRLQRCGQVPRNLQGVEHLPDIGQPVWGVVRR